MNSLAKEQSQADYKKKPVAALVKGWRFGMGIIWKSVVPEAQRQHSAQRSLVNCSE